MAFPYLGPIKSWVKEILDDREGNRINISRRIPFAILSSGAWIYKSDTLAKAKSEHKQNYQNALANISSTPEYQGCVITNNIGDIENQYSKGPTRLGYDFNGKTIKVEGEDGKRISTPIIEDIEIDTSSDNSTLKTARVKVRCFSLKQLEMFEVFFLKPGMNLLLEFGDNALATNGGTPVSKLEDIIIPKQNYSNFSNLFNQFFIVNSETNKIYFNKLKSSKGSYDLIAGKLMTYSYSVDENSTYSIDLEIEQSNQMVLMIPLNENETEVSSLGLQSIGTTDLFNQTLAAIAKDFKIDLDWLTTNIKKEIWANHLFNFGKRNTTELDRSASNIPYISLHFIINFLLNYSAKKANAREDMFLVNPPVWYKDAALTQPMEFLPITIHKNLISSSDAVIFPKKDTPSFILPDKLSSDKIGIDTQNPKDTSIGNIDMESCMDVTIDPITNVITHTEKQIKIPDTFYNKNGLSVDTTNGNFKNGNGLNIFLKYIDVLEAWNKSYEKRDFFFVLLNMCNSNGYGLYDLVYKPQIENGPNTLVDVKHTRFNKTAIVRNDTMYRFKPTHLNSMVRDFQFNFTMDQDVGGMTLFNSQKFLSNMIKTKGKSDNSDISQFPELFQHIDQSTFGNADGYVSINYIDYLAIKNTWKEIIPTTQSPNKIPPPTIEERQSNFNTLLNTKSIKFKKSFDSKSEKELTTYIFTDYPIIYNKIYNKNPQSEEINSTVMPIDLSLTIDGLSGLSSGEFFQTDAVPEIYNQLGVFQITNIKHKIDVQGWTTIIEAWYRTVEIKS